MCHETLHSFILLTMLANKIIMLNLIEHYRHICWSTYDFSDYLSISWHWTDLKKLYEIFSTSDFPIRHLITFDYLILSIKTIALNFLCWHKMIYNPRLCSSDIDDILIIWKATKFRVTMKYILHAWLYSFLIAYSHSLFKS